MADPVLGTPGGYGGTTQSIALLPGSPAIGAGSDSLSGVTVPGTDQRGVARPEGSVDVGAFQSQPFTYTLVSGGSAQRTTVNTAFANALTVIVSSEADDPVVGGVVGFAAPSEGASASLSAATSTIGEGGVASVTATPDGTVGGYGVAVLAAGGVAAADFALTNDSSGAAVADSTTGLTSSLNPATVGQSITFTATVAPASGSGTPTGTVVFTIDGQAEPPVALAVVNGRDQATFSTTTLAAGPHTVSAAYGGDAAFGPSAATTPLTETVSAAAPLATVTQLASSASSSTAGPGVTFTAVVSGSGSGAPTGTVTFTIDGGAGISVPLSVVGGRDQATLTIATLATGSHTIVASYSGDAAFVQSQSGPQTQVVSASVVDGPKVISVRRYGYHMMPTRLVLTFDQALDAATAQDAEDYRIMDSAGDPIAIKSAVYDASTSTVTLHPVERISIHHRYELIVGGTARHGVTNARGVLLDGARSGQPGSDYRTSLAWRNLVLNPTRARGRQ